MNIKTKKLQITEAVNALLIKSSVPAKVTIEQCANALAMSMTTFRRKLSQEETSFKLIQQKFLNELSVDALLTHHENIDSLVIKLGYSERATFERAFRHKFGVTPSQFRDLSLLGKDKKNLYHLTEIVENLPPLSTSCQQLLKEKDHESLDLPRVIDIITQDPIFTGRVMGLASRAIYGKTPNNIQEAVGRSLGINTVVNLAVIFSVKDALAEQVAPEVINHATQAFLMAPKLFQLLRKALPVKVKFDITLVEQVLVFALLGILLLCHKKSPNHQLMEHSLKGIESFDLLNRYISEAMGVSVLSASTLILSLWHIDANVIKELNHLDKINKQSAQASPQDEFVLFMIACLYSLATDNKNEALAQKAQQLKIEGFSEISDWLFAEK